jgi:hypothetical protein
MARNFSKLLCHYILALPGKGKKDFLLFQMFPQAALPMRYRLSGPDDLQAVRKL